MFIFPALFHLFSLAHGATSHVPRVLLRGTRPQHSSAIRRVAKHRATRQTLANNRVHTIRALFQWHKTLYRMIHFSIDCTMSDLYAMFNGDLKTSYEVCHFTYSWSIFFILFTLLPANYLGFEFFLYIYFLRRYHLCLH